MIRSNCSSADSFAGFAFRDFGCMAGSTDRKSNAYIVSESPRFFQSLDIVPVIDEREFCIER